MFSFKGLWEKEEEKKGKDERKDSVYKGIILDIKGCIIQI